MKHNIEIYKNTLACKVKLTFQQHKFINNPQMFKHENTQVYFVFFFGPQDQKVPQQTFKYLWMVPVSGDWCSHLLSFVIRISSFCLCTLQMTMQPLSQEVLGNAYCTRHKISHFGSFHVKTQWLTSTQGIYTLLYYVLQLNWNKHEYACQLLK